MAQMEARAPEYLSDIAKQNIEKFGAIQTQFLDALNQANREWLDCLNKAGQANSNLSQKMTTAKSVPEVTAAYQEWTTKQLELLIAEAKMIFEHTQDFAKTYTEIVGGKTPSTVHH